MRISIDLTIFFLITINLKLVKIIEIDLHMLSRSIVSIR